MQHHSLLAWSGAAFFLMGLSGSVHCVGMCGPLSLLWLAPARPGGWGRMGLYHLGRTLSYTLLAALFYRFRKTLDGDLVFSWGTVILIALGMGYGLSFSARFGSLGRRLEKDLFAWLRRFSSASSAPFLFGVFTPLLPCGLLYAAFAASLLALSLSDAVGGMLLFVLGTVPLLSMGQKLLRVFLGRFTPRQMTWASRIGVAIGLVAAGVLRFLYPHH